MTTKEPTIWTTQASTTKLSPPGLTKEQIEHIMKTTQLEAKANAEYRSERYHSERGGPALAALNEWRKVPYPPDGETHAFDLPVCP